MRIIVLFLLLIMSIPILTKAHVGSPGVVLEGSAGPYKLVVSINPPDVIPGVAEVSIYTFDPEIDHVMAKPIYWGYGDEGSPKADEMPPSKESAGMYKGIVWLMDRGTASIEVSVKGEKGLGSCVVPIMAQATAQNEMSPGLGWILSGLGLLLVILIITIIGFAMSDAITSPSDDNKNLGRQRRKGWVIGGLFMIVLLTGGNAWWEYEASLYNQFMYKPPKAKVWATDVGGYRKMIFQIDSMSLKDRDRLPMEYLVPDHGKLMHMFMIKEGSLDVFAHLHPRRTDPLTFEVNLPNVPKGRYLVFGDIVRLNGFVETVFDTLEIKVDKKTHDITNWRNDPDDTFIISTPFNGYEADEISSNVLICGKPGIETPLLDGSKAYFEHRPNQSFRVGKVYPLTFAFNDPDGKPALLEPYMGMMGHAVVFRKEGGVFVHLHPVGNYSMASQQIIETRINENSSRPKIPEIQVFYDSINQVVNHIAAMSEEERNET